MTRVAMIGIGAMGEPMAANLLKKGFALSVLRHRRSEPAERLRALGATLAASAAEAASGCEIAVLCLPTSREVEQVVTGRNGIAQAAAPGALVIDCSTSEPASTRRLAALFAERGIDLIDAGMTRGVQGARQGKLAFFLGGERAAVDRAMPVLEALGDTFVHLGPVGHGHTAKIVSNVLSYGTVALVNEALMLGTRGGVDGAKLFEALMQGAPSKALESFGPRMLAGDYDPARVSVDHVCEDMLMAQELARDACAPVYLLAVAQQLYRQFSLRGDGERDMSAIAELWRAAPPPKR